MAAEGSCLTSQCHLGRAPVLGICGAGSWERDEGPWQLGLTEAMHGFRNPARMVHPEKLAAAIE